MVVRPGDVIRHHPLGAAEPLTATVDRLYSLDTAILCDGEWIPTSTILTILSHESSMPSPSAISAAAQAGRVCVGPGRAGRPRLDKGRRKAVRYRS